MSPKVSVLPSGAVPWSQSPCWSWKYPAEDPSHPMAPSGLSCTSESLSPQALQGVTYGLVFTVIIANHWVKTLSPTFSPLKNQRLVIVYNN